MNRFVISDIHGAHKALEQCLQRANFNNDIDLLICLGDTADGYPDVKKCFTELIKVKNMIYILGNHDSYLYQFFETKVIIRDWLFMSGRSSLLSYKEKVNQTHLKFMRKAKLYHEMDDMLFVHAGFNHEKPMYNQNENTLLWDGDIVCKVICESFKPEHLTKYRKVFLGHTPTLNYKSEIPIFCKEFRFIDTGAGYGNKLSIMNIDTDEVFQSDSTLDLYGYSARA